jgi:hypothetical protein
MKGDIMTKKQARKVLRKYDHAIAKHNSGIETMPAWLSKLVVKCKNCLIKED